MEDGVTGRLVPERDPEAMAQAILDLRNDPIRARELARAGRQRVLEQFTAADNAARLLALFREALAAQGDHREYVGKGRTAELTPGTE